MSDFFSGVFATAFFASGLFFFRFWEATRDRLFFWFGIATWLLAAERIPLLVMQANHEFRPAIYLIRMAAYCLILIAVVQKNLEKAAPPARV